MATDSQLSLLSSSPISDRELGSTQRKLRLAFAFALLCLGVVGLISYLSILHLRENAARVEHTHEILNRIELLLAAATDSETAERGYVITGDESYLDPYRQSAEVVDNEAKQLRRLTVDNSVQQQRLDSVVALTNDRLTNLQLVIGLRRDQGFEARARQ
jgi:CHASE3 domain sensor protein